MNSASITTTPTSRLCYTAKFLHSVSFLIVCHYFFTFSISLTNSISYFIINVLTILHPFKVLCSVVGLDAVLMVYDLAFSLAEMACNELVNE